MTQASLTKSDTLILTVMIRLATKSTLDTTQLHGHNDNNNNMLENTMKLAMSTTVKVSYSSEYI